VTTTERPNVNYGYRDIALKNEILRSTVGSELHGITIPGDNSDHDELGVFIEPKEFVIGLAGNAEHYISRTQPEGVRSGAGDTDLTIYSLRKYIGLAIKGNPTVLLPLFAPESDLIVQNYAGEQLRSIRDSFLSLDAVNRFLGYMHGQHERMMGRGRQSDVPNRPELVEKYGFDTKYAGHALRLAIQGYELATEGTIHLPMKDEHIETIRRVKRGEFTKYDVSDMVGDYERQLERLLNANRIDLPEHADVAGIGNWMTRAHMNAWLVAS
jgi:hypothetical protein